MSDDELPPCTHICDIAALHEIATTKSGNLKKVLQGQLESGQLAVPSVVLKEFRELYEDLAAAIEPLIARTVDLKLAYRSAAASIADKTKSGFPRKPYDGDTDLYTAAIASVENYTVVTTAHQVSAYDGMGCKLQTVENWVDELDSGTKE